MKRFNHFKERYPNVSSIVWLSKAVSGMKFSRIQIAKYVKLLEKEDYTRGQLPELVEHFNRLTKEGKLEEPKIGV
jgi:hypothetical protein